MKKHPLHVRELGAEPDDVPHGHLESTHAAEVLQARTRRRRQARVAARVQRYVDPSGARTVTRQFGASPRRAAPAARRRRVALRRVRAATRSRLRRAPWPARSAPCGANLDDQTASAPPDGRGADEARGPEEASAAPVAPAPIRASRAIAADARVSRRRRPPRALRRVTPRSRRARARRSTRLSARWQSRVGRRGGDRGRRKRRALTSQTNSFKKKIRAFSSWGCGGMNLPRLFCLLSAAAPSRGFSTRGRLRPPPGFSFSDRRNSMETRGTSTPPPRPRTRRRRRSACGFPGSRQLRGRLHEVADLLIHPLLVLGEDVRCSAEALAAAHAAMSPLFSK